MSASALWALRRFCSALSTVARAEAIAAGDGVVLCWVDAEPEDTLELVVAGAGDRAPLVPRPD